MIKDPRGIAATEHKESEKVLDRGSIEDVYRFEENDEYVKFKGLVSRLEVEWYQEFSERVFDDEKKTFVYGDSKFFNVFNYKALPTLSYQGKYDVVINGRYAEKNVDKIYQDRDESDAPESQPLNNQTQSWRCSASALLEWMSGSSSSRYTSLKKEIRSEENSISEPFLT